MKIRKIIRTVSFLLVFMLLFLYVNTIFTIPNGSTDNSGRINTFYDQPKNTIDVALVGPSQIYTSWNSMLAWHDYGISSYAWSTGGQPSSAIPYIIKEIEKTQSPKVYVIEYHRLADLFDEHKYIRSVADLMPFSLNRIQALHYMLETTTEEVDEDNNHFDYYLSIIKYHKRWEKDLYELVSSKPKSKLKGTLIREKSFRTIKQPDDTSHVTEQATLEADEYKNVLHILDYIKENDIPVMFVTIPKIMDAQERATLNAIEKVLTEEGFKYYDLNEATAQMGFSYANHYYDHSGIHPNFDGMNSITKYLADNLETTYNLKDHRGDSKYSLWDDAYAEYDSMVKGIQQKLFPELALQ